MTRLPVLALLLACACLRTLPANSQVLPDVVELKPGDLVARPLYGLTFPTYLAVRQQAYADSVQLGIRQQLIDKLESRAVRDSVQAVRREADLQECRDSHAAIAGDYVKLGKVTDKAFALPATTPLLLDPVFYKGAGAGAVLAFLLSAWLAH